MKNCFCRNKDIADAVKKLDPFHNDRYNMMDDIASGRLFADIFRDVCRYNPTSKTWWKFNGKIWMEDAGDMTVNKLAKQLARALYLYSVDTSAEYRKYVGRLGDRRRREIMLKDARDAYSVTTDEFDSHPELFNCQNGIYNLQTGEWMDHHEPSLLLSKISNVYYNPAAACPEWEKFIRTVMCGDESKVQYIKRIFGYSLTPQTGEEELYLCYGATTRNGKSTALETFGYLMGDYALTISPESLAQKKDKRGSAPNSDIARLFGTRFVHVPEPSKGMILDVALVKDMTGNDEITARFLNQEFFNFRPTFKFFINANHRPVVNDTTLFDSDRVRVITFDKHFSESERDTGLKHRMLNRDNISGLFNWCLEGLKEYTTGGMMVPDAVHSATDDYMLASDKMQNFINDCLVKDIDSVITAKRTYEIYKLWCDRSGYGTEGKKNFLSDLRAKRILADTGTVNGRTEHNVIIGYCLDNDTTRDMEYPQNPFR